jgi:uncharacterized OB-fold protein
MDAPDKYFRDSLKAGQFRLQRCAACRRHIFFPRVLCPHCGGVDLEWRDASGRATVYSTTVVRRKPDEGGDFNVVLVDLAEGPRLMSRVEGIAPTAVKIGMAVRARIDRAGEDAFLVFTPALARAGA